MEPKSFHRKLTAILSADVAGYSRLMQDDEAATVKTLEAYKQIISDLVKQHRGRVVDSPGDNLLAEFASVVDAVQCAVATQKELQARNAELPENRRMQFRIGVNLGDVIEEESRIYGDGVNIAARLESLADPGGICVSKTAFDQIETKLPFGYEFLGEQTVKNIAKPVGAYRVVLEPRVTKRKGTGLKQGAGRKIAVSGLAVALLVTAGVALWQVFLRPTAPPAPPVEKADLKQMALPLPDLPSIAVLPFVSLSEDPKQQLLCDGITDNIILASSPFYNHLGLAFRLTGRLEEAVALNKKSLLRAPNDFWVHAALASIYIEMGRDEEARAAAAEVLRINPKFSLELYARTSLLKDRSVVDKTIDTLRKAGLPDKPPPAQP
jgi:adenylate cyclase